mmetsp:Transcript_92694/g.164800  ORF Transcript_92694/g.164800 Transcript_92694/m.164800 type:complete len:658 (-) Transcript_92694:40-2013(-)|eukprot:CAMPEP_0197630418 /NCGR_PEP_ID=MMETSP1338-20131121/7907_1 /TAXON_ID=43686 ORGANISM="Pelagodinium beii, Strain RCC1491" /NCGR_SAMPLE_ID=MMETSP1338 /ASSEMBLY_ACC=CAM_ASM_000754 /LENGTH=657 /DNA_ID=CAMNT_0043201629 /DNA_START=58 /DNA_END=2031 /DNA_ORIENTATION=+
MGRLGWIVHSSNSYVAHVAAAPLHVPSPGGAQVSIVDAIPSSLCRGGAALAAGGGLSALTWLGRRGRRTRVLHRPPSAASASVAATAASRHREPPVPKPRPRERRQETPALSVHFLYATPILRPDSSERLPPLSWKAEAEAVRSALGAGYSEDYDNVNSAHERVRLEVTAATVDRLSQLATAPATASGGVWWHIAAHSQPGTGRLILEDEDGAAQPVSMSALMFSCRRPPLGALVLACAGEEVGRAFLASGVSFVVVATGPLRDVTARSFASHFYRRLQCSLANASPAHVRFAFRAAREALESSTSAAVRSEAPRLVLLEQGNDAVPVPRGTSSRSQSSAWVPLVMSSATQASMALSRVADADAAAGSPAVEAVEDKAVVSAERRELAERPSEDIFDVASPEDTERLQDCEDFLGRGPELQRLMQLLGASEGRRLIVLNGASGCGKSALGAELCRFATAPGRKFSPVKGKKRLAYLSLHDAETASDEGVKAACAQVLIMAAVESLASGPDVGRVCLLVDHAEQDFGWRDEFVQEILDRRPNLCLLITRRSPLYRLEGRGGDRWKPVNIALGALTDREAAQLFLQRLHRPLFRSDFVRDSVEKEQKDAMRPLPSNGDLLRRISELPAVAACAGRPQQVVRLASQVTHELPSLLDLLPA